MMVSSAPESSDDVITGMPDPPIVGARQTLVDESVIAQLGSALVASLVPHTSHLEHALADIA